MLFRGAGILLRPAERQSMDQSATQSAGRKVGVRSISFTRRRTPKWMVVRHRLLLHLLLHSLPRAAAAPTAQCCSISSCAFSRWGATIQLKPFE